ncbi:glycogen debranching protein [Fulvivirga sp.]|uniref:alpha-L-rhamnosidase-related protein n=1 Tax=Fulvivirga sp. TaxID=1931237 RepID=UPI0032F06AEA
MRFIYVLLLLVIFSCSPNNKSETPSFNNLMDESPSITGKPEYLNSPFVTAGDRVYVVGHQDGSFPELGWHIKDEMGGIWNHPIKLMDGFEVALEWGEEAIVLNNAESFTNYPMAGKHSFSIEEKGLAIDHWQFVPDHKQGILIQFIIENKSNQEQSFNFQFTGSSDLRPTWLGERTNMVDDKDTAEFDSSIDGWIVKDGSNPWFTVFTSDEKSTAHQSEEYKYSGKGVANSITQEIKLVGKSTAIINYFVAGSYTSKEDALNTLQDLKSNAHQYFSAKKERYAQLANQSKLTIPDKKLQKAFEWLKYNADWMIQTVPEIGTGITAGIPDYPWWFGVDSEYALKGYMAVGQHDIVYKTISLLDSLSEVTNGNGRIIHETSTNGAVFNPGNINETPQFASLIWEVYQWNGDKEFLKKYFPTIKKGLSWLMEENDENKNLFPDGFGMMEIHGMDAEMIDVAVYTQKAFADAAQIAIVLGEQAVADEYSTTAANLKSKINDEFWSDEFNSYADFIGSDEQALKLIDDAIIRADTLKKPWAVEELKQTKAFIKANPSKELRPFVLHHNWVVNTPMEMGIADSAKAIKALNTAEQFVNPFGVFVTGIDRDESAGTDDGSFKGSKIFSYTGAVMTLPTSVQAVGENNYGHPDKALNYLERMTRSFSYAHPGSMYEVSPDYGMLVQAWNIYGFAVPIVKQFFGINPDVANKTIVIAPQMPTSWDKASLENVIVGANEVSVFYEMSQGKLILKVNQTNPDYKLKIQLPKRGFDLVKSSIEPLPNSNKYQFETNDKLVEIDLNVKN